MPGKSPSLEPFRNSRCCLYRWRASRAGCAGRQRASGRARILQHLVVNIPNSTQAWRDARRRGGIGTRPWGRREGGGGWLGRGLLRPEARAPTSTLEPPTQPPTWTRLQSPRGGPLPHHCLRNSVLEPGHELMPPPTPRRKLLVSLQFSNYQP